ncbi:MAG TPA: hypothetical protein VGE21_01850 [Flavobacteriales bacterium]
MRSRWVLVVFLLPTFTRAQIDDQGDTITNVYQLGELVIRGNAEGLDLEGFMHQVMEDTSFQHAFLNTRYHAHRLRSNFRVRNKGEKETATLFREAHLQRTGPDARLVLDSVSESGKLRDGKGGFRFLTAEMYDEVFFPKGQWRADNTIRAHREQAKPQGRIAEYKSELKQFMFSPGQEIASVPFVGRKLALYDPDLVGLYDHTIGTDARSGHLCWKFASTAKDEGSNSTVIKRMVTWFDQSTMQVIAREYRIQHGSILLDFDIRIRVENTIVDDELVPTTVHYDGDWDIPLKKRELVRFQLDYSDWSVE